MKNFILDGWWIHVKIMPFVRHTSKVKVLDGSMHSLDKLRISNISVKFCPANNLMYILIFLTWFRMSSYHHWLKRMLYLVYKSIITHTHAHAHAHAHAHTHIDINKHLNWSDVFNKIDACLSKLFFFKDHI